MIVYLRTHVEILIVLVTWQFREREEFFLRCPQRCDIDARYAPVVGPWIRPGILSTLIRVKVEVELVCLTRAPFDRSLWAPTVQASSAFRSRHVAILVKSPAAAHISSVLMIRVVLDRGQAGDP